MFAEFFRGLIVVELLQLIGASWMLFSGPEKLQKCFKINAAPLLPSTFVGLLQLVLLGNLNHLLLKLFLLFNLRFSQLHTLHALCNCTSALFFFTEVVILHHLTFCPFVLTQLCFNGISVFGTVLFWLSECRVVEGKEEAKARTRRLRGQNANGRQFKFSINTDKMAKVKKMV